MVLLFFCVLTDSVPSVLWHCWLGGRKGIRPIKTEWWGAVVVICLEWVADLHMCHCHSLSLASVKSRLVLPFWYQLTRVIPDKGPLKGCVCVCEWFCFPVLLSFQLQLTWPPRFLAECCKRQLNQGSFLLYFNLFAFSDLYWVWLSVFSCTVLFVSISQVIGCEDRLRNDLNCVEYSNSNTTNFDYE